MTRLQIPFLSITLNSVCISTVDKQQDTVCLGWPQGLALMGDSRISEKNVIKFV
jgi:hypothetical protein